MKSLLYGLSVLAALTLFSCKKEGPGGANTLVIYPQHHEKAIPGTMVYIKYGTDEFPGEDVSNYDASVVAESGHGTVHAHFEGLQKGKYYLYGVGYDSAVPGPVKGGLPVEIKEKSGETPVTLYITE